jgi:hypothetical protein
MPEVHKMLFHALLLFLLVGSTVGLFIGAALLLRPSWLMCLSKYVNRWIAVPPITNQLDRVVKVDRWFYRHHQASGISLLAGAIFLIYFVTARIDKPSILIRLSEKFHFPPALFDVLLDSAVLIILLGASATLIIGLFLLIRPSMLRGFERESNQWIPMPRPPESFDILHVGVDEYVFQNVQMTGALLLFGSLYILAALTLWL